MKTYSAPTVGSFGGVVANTMFPGSASTDQPPGISVAGGVGFYL